MITESLVRDYRNQGFCVLPTRLSESELELLSTAADTLLNEPGQNSSDDRLHDIDRGQDRRHLRLRHEDLPELAAFVLGDQMQEIATALLGADPYLFVEQFVVKGPTTGASFAWHQDGGYVGFEHRPYLSLWIAVDAASESNGCVYILPRSLDDGVGLAPHEWDEANKERVGYLGDEKGVAMDCPAGTIVAFSSMTMHRSGPNTTGQPRRAYICQYSPEPILDPATGMPKHFAKPFPPGLSV